MNAMIQCSIAALGLATGTVQSARGAVYETQQKSSVIRNDPRNPTTARTGRPFMVQPPMGANDQAAAVGMRARPAPI